MGYSITFPSQGAAFVVGGSGGAGSKICELLAQAGTPVAFTYFRGKERAERTLKKVQSHTDKSAAAYALDGRDAANVKSVVDQVAKDNGGIHTVIYAGGPVFDFLPLSQTTPEYFHDIVMSDICSFFNLLHASTDYLRESRGSLTACVSFANQRVLDCDGLSAAPKAAVESMIRQYAAEEGQYGVRANSVGLGWIDVGVGSADSEQSVHKAFGEEAMNGLRQVIRLESRPGSGEEFANMVVFAASQQASYLTGQRILMDGGGSL